MARWGAIITGGWTFSAKAFSTLARAKNRCTQGSFLQLPRSEEPWIRSLIIWGQSKRAIGSGFEKDSSTPGQASMYKTRMFSSLVCLCSALKSFQDPFSMCRLERSVNSAERTRESASKRYRSFHIPWEWMLDTGLIGQVGNIWLIFAICNKTCLLN